LSQGANSRNQQTYGSSNS